MLNDDSAKRHNLMYSYTKSENVRLFSIADGSTSGHYCYLGTPSETGLGHFQWKICSGSDTKL